MLNKISLKHTTLQLVVALCTMTVLSCSDDEDSELSPDKLCPISFSIEQVGGMQTTRTMIENATDLQNACTPKEAGNANYLGEAIGLWGDVETAYGQADSVFADRWLAYGTIGNVPYNPKNKWNYYGDNRYWLKNATYKFRAIYPRILIAGVSYEYIDKENSSAEALLTSDYFTQYAQRDLMVAYAEANTTTATPENIELKMQHALTAIQFDFKLQENTPNKKLTDVWLQPTTGSDLIVTGVLNYNTENLTEANWTHGISSTVGYKTYHWANSEGLTLSTTATTAYTTPSGTTTTTGSHYTNNKGSLLIIPQQSTGTVELHFIVSGKEYKIMIPANTGTESTYKPGKRYIYTVTISNNIELTLRIVDWNERKSTFDITF